MDPVSLAGINTPDCNHFHPLCQAFTSNPLRTFIFFDEINASAPHTLSATAARSERSRVFAASRRLLWRRHQGTQMMKQPETMGI